MASFAFSRQTDFIGDAGGNDSDGTVVFYSSYGYSGDFVWQSVQSDAFAVWATGLFVVDCGAIATDFLVYSSDVDYAGGHLSYERENFNEIKGYAKRISGLDGNLYGRVFVGNGAGRVCEYASLAVVRWEI